MLIPQELEQTRSNSPEGKGPGLATEPGKAEYHVSSDDRAPLCFPHLQMRLHLSPDHPPSDVQKAQETGWEKALLCDVISVHKEPLAPPRLCVSPTGLSL